MSRSRALVIEVSIRLSASLCWPSCLGPAQSGWWRLKSSTTICSDSASKMVRSLGITDSCGVQPPGGGL